MSEPDVLLATVLGEGGGALAAYAAAELLERDPQAEEVFQPDASAGWRGFLERRLRDLAAAVAHAEPDVFASQVRWAAAAFAGRGAGVEHLRHAMEALGGVLAAELPPPARPAAADYISTALEALEEGPPELPPELSPEAPDGRLALSYVLALLEGDARRAMRLVLDAAEDGRTPQELYLNVLVPALRETGRMWLVGELSIAEEHLVTATTKTAICRLLFWADFSPPNGKTVVAACVQGNRHDVAVQLLSSLFEMDGWRVVCLGADVPVPDVVSAAADFGADLVVLSAALTTHLGALERTVRTVRRNAPASGVKVLAGGAVFRKVPALAERLGADACTEDVEEAVRIGRHLVGLPPQDAGG